MTNKKHFSKHFEPDTAFFDLPLIRLTLLVGFSVVMGLVIAISVVDWREPDWSAAGFNELITMFKLPIGLLAFFAALLALFATNHRSEQNKQAMALTQRSIEVTGAQNRFANYYKHLEEFAKYCRSIEGECSDGVVKIKDRDLHNFLFSNIRNGDTKIPSSVELHFINIFSRVAGSATNFLDVTINNDECTPNLNLVVILVEFAEAIQSLSKYLKVESLKNEMNVVLNNCDNQYRSGVEQLIILQIQFLVLREAMKFDPVFNVINLCSIDDLAVVLNAIRFRQVKSNGLDNHG